MNPQPRPGNPSAIGVAWNDPNRAFFVFEHDGAIENANSPVTSLKWQYIPDYGLNLVHVGRFLVAPGTNPRWLYMMTSAGDQVAFSDNDGALTPNSWRDSCTCDPVGPLPNERPSLALAIDPSKPAWLLAGMKNGNMPTTTPIKWSKNSGCTWENTAFPSGIPLTMVTDIEYADSTFVWAATSNSSIYPVETPGSVPNPTTGCAGAFYSDTAGGVWVHKPISPGNPADCV